MERQRKSQTEKSAHERGLLFLCLAIQKLLSHCYLCYPPAAHRYFAPFSKVSQEQQAFLKYSIDKMQVRTLQREASAYQPPLCQEARSACNACLNIGGNHVNVLNFMVNSKDEEHPDPHIFTEPK